MGMNLNLVTEDGRDIPEWDCARFAGDREFAQLIWLLPHLRHPKATMAPWQENRFDELVRPDCIAAWRGALPADRPNPERLLELLDILEARPEVWISISY